VNEFVEASIVLVLVLHGTAFPNDGDWALWIFIDRSELCVVGLIIREHQIVGTSTGPFPALHKQARQKAHVQFEVSLHA
jgi:hypothetical protein